MQDEVWRALGSPHRRRLLDLLAAGPRTTGQLAEAVPTLSRFAVMQHLDVLSEAGLVLVRREGRHRFNHLNAVPLREVYERWVSRFGDAAAGRAVALKRYVEEQGGGDMPVVEEQVARVVHIENELRVHAPREKVWQALCDEQHKWYPHNYGGERLRRIVFEPRVGGTCYEDWGDGRGISYGTVKYFDPPNSYCLMGSLRGGTTLEHWYELSIDGDQTVVKQSMYAFGPITEEGAEGIRTHGDLSRFEKNLRDWVERGEAVGS
ncbi:MAG TPA: helix-turn-helix domain-containing protein [Actinomycetota bacterium]|nr:helix-turn-helix domain-containing protein [Actinomycetota bacterium]